MRLSFLVLALAASLAPALLAPACASAQSGSSLSPTGRTWANPIDIDDKYNFEQAHEGISYRTAADPTIVLHRDRYYLFVTKADGYWTSTNLLDWTFVTPSRWPLDGSVAPAAVSDGDRLYLMQSASDPMPMLSSDRPEIGRWDFHTRLTPPIPGAVGGRDPDPGPNDQLPAGPYAPDLFIDDDGRWYLYWGASDVFPLYGSEIDPKPPVSFIDTPTSMFGLAPLRHGWERFGQDNSGTMPDGSTVQPFIDGAWMTRHGNRYYLQYSAPGSDYNAYAIGTYVGASPLGPFSYAPWNPISAKPGGFVQGSGHGSTFQDRYGNWWNAGTSWVGLNWTFERRVAMYPGAFHDDGQLFFTSRFGDFPQKAADGPVLDPDSLFTGWMPLSYRTVATASSTLDGFPADRATDEDPRTFWVAATNTPGQTLTLDLGDTKTVQAVQVNYADYQSGVYADEPGLRTRFRITYSPDGVNWATFASRMSSERDSPNAYVQGEKPVRARYIRYEHGESPGTHLAISDLRVFGNAMGSPPPAPTNVVVSRSEDQRNAVIRFDPVGNPAGGRILGYNVRWGVKADRLHQTYQIWADDLAARGGQVEIHSLNVGVEYDFAVEAFADTGVSALSTVLAVPAGAASTVRAPDAPVTGLAQPSDRGTPPASGVVITTIPPVYISGAPPVTGTDLPNATGSRPPATAGQAETGPPAVAVSPIVGPGEASPATAAPTPTHVAPRTTPRRRSTTRRRRH
ncbi:family 43 glycosylhydrolase [soil metagenome]